MSSVVLFRMKPDLAALLSIATQRRFLPPGGDTGYALHAALAGLFGGSTPKPFLLLERRDGPEILAYTTKSMAEVQTLAALPPTGELRDLAETLCPATLVMRPMPTTWTRGQRLGFSVRIRPVVRVRSQGKDAPLRERDAYQWAWTRADGPPPDREGVYRDWLARELERDGAARLDTCAMASFRRTRVLRRPFLEGGGRSERVSEGPDAVFVGDLVIEDPEAFGKLLARGVGRHRSFGFGMLLLSPPGRSS